MPRLVLARLLAILLLVGPGLATSFTVERRAASGSRSCCCAVPCRGACRMHARTSCEHHGAASQDDGSCAMRAARCAPAPPATLAPGADTCVLALSISLIAPTASKRSAFEPSDVVTAPSWAPSPPPPRA